MAKNTDEEFSNQPTEISMMASSDTISEVDSERLFVLMDTNTQEAGKTANRMGMVSTIILNSESTQAIGRMT